MLDTNFRNLEQSLRVVSTAIAGQCDLAVKFEPNAHPRMNLKTRTITLPSCPINPDKDYKAMYLGFLVHECSHAKFTPMSNETLPELGFRLANIFEDGRIEYLIPQSIGGAKGILSDLVAILVSNGFFSEPSKDCHPVNAFTGYLLYQIRGYRLNQTSLRDYADKARAIFITIFGNKLLVKLDLLIDRLFDNVDDRFISYDLAKEALKLLQDELDFESEGQESDSDDSDNESEESEPESEQNSDGPLSDEPDESYSSEDSNDGNSSSSQTEDDNSSNDNVKSSTAEPSSDEISSIKETINSLLDAESEDFESCMGDLGDALGEEISEPEGVLEHYDYKLVKPISGLDQRILRQAIQASSNVAPKLKNLLVTRAPKYKRKQAFGNQFDERSISRVVTGETNIYKRKRPSKAVDTAITLLVDASGSMCGTAMEHALLAALATCTTLEFINNLSISVATFSDCNSITVLKDFNVKARSVSSAFNRGASGSTPMTEGLMWARDTILKARKQRNIVIVFTDGVPNNALSTKALIQQLNQSNVETWGIEFSSENLVQEYFSNYVKITSISDFSKALYSLFKTGFQHSYI